MSTGFLAFSESGQVVTDMTVLISQMQGSIVTAATNGSATLPPVPAGRQRFYMVVPLVDLNREKGKRPGVSISGNTMSWAYSYSTSGWGYFSANCRIYYGYY
ncbi:hypothetical protein CSV86_010180 [Pseudomonas putida CSV86]|uniref:Uncharacterized protein n=1 Tax=Pseudomonas bharatica CSV86 TaxID=1005395 RepID=L1M5Z8_9PSED|nr:hypothetical protein [Pseudomonas bharatica]NNJ15579.1 hypothetical protein [Pseudomonas bharatica CSV86]